MLGSLLIAVCPKILALIVGGYYFRVLTPPYRLIFFVTLLAGLVEIAGVLIYKVFHVPNAWIFNIYMIIEFSVYCIAAMHFLPNGVRKYIILAMLTGWSIWIYQIVRHSIVEFSVFSLVSGSLIIDVLYISILVLNTMHSSSALSKNPLFWLSISVVLYYVCDIPYMTVLTDTMNNYMHKKINMPSLDINNILNCITHLLVAFSFLLIGKQKDIAISK